MNDHGSLETLMESMGSRNTRALAEVKQATAAMLTCIAFRILRNHADADEMVAETYLRAWLHARKFDPARGSARSWLATLCRNSCIDRLRRLNVERNGCLLATDHHSYTASSPESLLEHHQMSTALAVALARLPGTQRQVVSMAFYQDLSHQEISASSQIPLGTVKSHLRRSLRRLQRELQAGGTVRNRVDDQTLYFAPPRSSHERAGVLGQQHGHAKPRITRTESAHS